MIDGAVREVAVGARWLGTLVRSLQTGLVRAYALILVFGAACFIVVLRARGRRALMALVLVTILLPIAAGALLLLLPRDDRNARRARSARWSRRLRSSR